MGPEDDEGYVPQLLSQADRRAVVDARLRTAEADLLDHEVAAVALRKQCEALAQMRASLTV